MSNVFGTVATRLLALGQPAHFFVVLKYTSLPEITFTVRIFYFVYWLGL